MLVRRAMTPLEAGSDAHDSCSEVVRSVGAAVRPIRAGEMPQDGSHLAEVRGDLRRAWGRCHRRAGILPAIFDAKATAPGVTTVVRPRINADCCRRRGRPASRHDADRPARGDATARTV